MALFTPYPTPTRVQQPRFPVTCSQACQGVSGALLVSNLSVIREQGQDI